VSDKPDVPKTSAPLQRSGDKPGRILSNRAIIISAVLVILLASGVTWLLLAHFGSGSDADKSRLEAIRTVGTIVLGAGGIIALLLAARRQQTAERDLAQKKDAQRYAEQDALERRITELYLKAADQLGSDKAPVRLAALHALERLAQGNSDQRQTIVNVICAYLRMPYTPPTTNTTWSRKLGYRRPIRPGHPLLIHRPAVSIPAPETTNSAQQEREVRLTAQSILATHLRPAADHVRASEMFWHNIDVDLNGATLIDFNLRHCQLRNAKFSKTKLIGDADFGAAKFTGNAEFHEAKFTGNVNFCAAKFTGHAEFREAEFTGNADFGVTEFTVDAEFSEAEFTGNADFNVVKFTRHAVFSAAKFTGNVDFREAEVTGSAIFDDAEFTVDAEFRIVEFNGRAFFSAAKFNGRAVFDAAKFTRGADFSSAKFTRGPEFNSARVRLDVDRARKSSWPIGWEISNEPPMAHPEDSSIWAKLIAVGKGDDTSSPGPEQT
jgi:uncharacterized protein YjbI with pentapeptide repeats